MTWPYWPIKLRTSSSRRGGLRARVRDRNQRVRWARRARSPAKTVRVQWVNGKVVEVPGSEQILKAGLVLLAMGLVSPVFSDRSKHSG